jgi:hypothetical protein
MGRYVDDALFGWPRRGFSCWGRLGWGWGVLVCSMVGVGGITFTFCQDAAVSMLSAAPVMIPVGVVGRRKEWLP